MLYGAAGMDGDTCSLRDRYLVGEGTLAQAESHTRALRGEGLWSNLCHCLGSRRSSSLSLHRPGPAGATPI